MFLFFTKNASGALTSVSPKRRENIFLTSKNFLSLALQDIPYAFRKTEFLVAKRQAIKCRGRRKFSSNINSHFSHYSHQVAIRPGGNKSPSC